jgi:hypothetical protein
VNQLQLHPTRPSPSSIDVFQLADAAREAHDTWRTRRRALRKAARLYALGNALLVARPHDWAARAERAYRGASRLLGERSPAGAPAARVRTLLHEARRPYRRFALALALSAFPTAGVLLVLLLLLAQVAPPLRDWLIPPDLGRRAVWTASSASQAAAIAGAGTNAGANAEAGYFFHTQFENRPWLRIDLPRVARIEAIRIENRKDCCQERALPLNVEVPDGDGWRLVCQRRVPFDSWTCHPGSLATRALRITIPGRAWLHLERVAIFE